MKIIEKKRLFGKIRDMFRFIKMWLLLRVLQHQEDYIVEKEKQAQLYLGGGRVIHQKSFFISNCSNLKIWLAFLPKIFRKQLRPKHIGEVVKEPVDYKIRNLDSIIREAKDMDYIETPDQLNLKPLDPNLEADDPNNHIVISPKGDDFVTYFGGLEALLKRYPHAWGFLIPILLTLIWSSWVSNHIVTILCTYITKFNFCP